MIVSKENFKQALPLFKQSLEECEFISFDCEMTGVMYDLKHDGTKYDTHEFRYFKYREIVKKFELLQIGITFYIKKEKNVEDKNFSNEIVVEKYYLERTFNFNLFKNSKLKFLSDLYSTKNEFAIFNSISVCHPATLKFLNENNFDFNSIITNGIHYNKLGNYEKIKNALNINFECGKIPNNITFLSKKNEKMILEVIVQITDFLINSSNTKIKKINNLNSFVVNYILGLKLKQLNFVNNFNISRDKTDLTNSTIVIEKSKTNLNSEEFVKKYENLENFAKSLTIDKIYKLKNSSLLDKNNLDSLIEEELGFSNCIDLLVRHNQTVKPIPIVGHNIFFDLLFIYDKFIMDLPDKFHEYKDSLNKHFPLIYDNKLITSRLASTFDNTKLEAIYKNIKKNKYDIYIDIKQDIPLGFANYSEIDSGKNFHDAGYDSLITGRCFIYVLKAIENSFETENKKGISHYVGNENVKKFEAVVLKSGYVDFNILQGYDNKTVISLLEEPFYLCNLNESFEHYRKNEELLINSYSNVYIAKFKTQENFISIYDISKLFENEQFNLSIVKIDDHAAFVEFIFDHHSQKFSSDEENNKKLIEEIINECKEKNDEKIDKLIPYREFYGNFNEVIILN